MNPVVAMRLLKAKNKFAENHPKFLGFLKDIMGSGMPEGTVVEVKITKPGEQPVVSNIVVKESDREVFDEIKNMYK